MVFSGGIERRGDEKRKGLDRMTVDDLIRKFFALFCDWSMEKKGGEDYPQRPDQPSSKGWGRGVECIERCKGM